MDKLCFEDILLPGLIETFLTFLDDVSIERLKLSNSLRTTVNAEQAKLSYWCSRATRIPNFEIPIEIAIDWRKFYYLYRTAFNKRVALDRARAFTFPDDLLLQILDKETSVCWLISYVIDADRVEVIDKMSLDSTPEVKKEAFEHLSLIAVRSPTAWNVLVQLLSLIHI